MTEKDLQFGRYNTKIKSYRDGSCTVVYCDKNIFMSDNEFIDDDPLLYAAALRSLNQSVTKSVAEELNISRPVSKAAEERKRSDSLKRAVDKVYDIAFQNDWKYFLTCTISDDNGFDRNSPIEVYEKLKIWLSNMVSRKDLQYMFIPEYHPNGNGIHLHGLVNDVLPLVDSGRILFNDGKAWRREDVVKRGFNADSFKTIYNCPAWKYGFTTAIPVSGSPARLACYITKYITKDTKQIFGKYYLSSRNIVREADVICCNTYEFDSCVQKPISHGGMKFKYKSDFLMREDDKNSGRNPTEEILKYLSDRGVFV